MQTLSLSAPGTLALYLSGFIMLCIWYGRSTTKPPSLGSAAGAAAGAEAGAVAGAEAGAVAGAAAGAVAGAVVEARMATGG